MTVWQQAIRDDRSMSAVQKSVAAFLSFRMDSDGRGGAFPGAVRLAADASLSRRATEQALRDLVVAGWLRVVRKANRRAGLATEYGISFPTAVDNPPLPANEDLLPANEGLLPANEGSITGKRCPPALQDHLYINTGGSSKSKEVELSPAEFVSRYGDVNFRDTFVGRVETYGSAPADKETTLALWDELSANNPRRGAKL